MPIAKIPLSALRVANGQFAATLAIHGLDPMSIVFDASELEILVTKVDALVCGTGGSRHSAAPGAGPGAPGG